MKFIRKRSVNVSFMFISTLICWYVFHRCYEHNNFQLGYFVLPWIPVLIGLVTFGVYLAADMFSHEHSWTTSIAGAVFNSAWVWMSLTNQTVS
ncbi:MAG: hypothetical protein AB8B55_15140 [Mariniblastus sp.]